MPRPRFNGAPFWALFAILAVLPMEANAYLDPGSGSYFFQILIGVVLSLAFSVRMMGSRLIAFFKSLFSRSRHDDHSDRPG